MNNSICDHILKLKQIHDKVCPLYNRVTGYNYEECDAVPNIENKCKEMIKIQISNNLNMLTKSKLDET